MMRQPPPPPSKWFWIVVALLTAFAVAHAQAPQQPTPVERLDDIENALAALAAKVSVLKGEIQMPIPPQSPGQVTTSAEFVAQVASQMRRLRPSRPCHRGPMTDQSMPNAQRPTRPVTLRHAGS